MPRSRRVGNEFHLWHTKLLRNVRGQGPFLRTPLLTRHLVDEKLLFTCGFLDTNFTQIHQSRPNSPYRAHWDLTRNQRSQRAGGLTVGVENGCDEVNVQIPEEEKRKTFFDRFFLTKSFAEETRVIGQELEKDRYAATERVFRLATELELK
ncbi:hypothetical protein F2Q70_00012314 [Brassica cretica]|uniref:Uncharacterized protein n=1 Tax=Brassica cretica TaxID=69181 RepID=A0A8S9MAD0_BRACR|nr:hypothetical protein F2Q68_00005428 [Brassica cretica]KAF2614759.1 hypothetical protein F2Q70_00012314 [Brassica cretica]